MLCGEADVHPKFVGELARISSSTRGGTNEIGRGGRSTANRVGLTALRCVKDRTEMSVFVILDLSIFFRKYKLTLVLVQYPSSKAVSCGESLTGHATDTEVSRACPVTANV